LPLDSSAKTIKSFIIIRDYFLISQQVFISKSVLTAKNKVCMLT